MSTPVEKIRCGEYSGHVVLGCKCHEKTGNHFRFVYYVEATSDLLDWLWIKMQGIPTIISNLPLHDREQLDVLLDPTLMVFLIDDVGIAVFKFESTAMLHMHVTFWDKRFRGREGLVQDLCHIVLARSRVDQIMTFIPSSSRFVIGYAKKVGFKICGWSFLTAQDRQGNPDDQVIMSFGG